MCQDHYRLGQEKIKLKRNRKKRRGSKEKKEFDWGSGLHSYDFGWVKKRSEEKMKKEEILYFSNPYLSILILTIV